MRTRVKYCGLVRPNDVDAAVAIGADAVGFVFYPKSPRHVDPDTAARLRRRLPSWVTAVGLFVNEPAPLVDRTAARIGLDIVQLHGDEAPVDAQALGVRWWKALRIDASGRVQGLPAWTGLAAALRRFDAAEFCLLDSASAGFGGSGHGFDWSLVPVGAGSRLILSGGLEPGNVGDAIDRVGPFAVDTSTGIQGQTPREKDVGRMEQFMAAVRQADQRRSPMTPRPAIDETLRPT